MVPEFLTELEAKTALETPQAVLTWSFDSDVLSPLGGVEWSWQEMVLRRSSERWPESVTDGDGLLTEAYSEEPSTSLADLTLEALTEHYYSLFFKYTEHDSSPILLNQDVERLGSVIYSVFPDENETIVQETDGQSYGTTNFTSAGSTFLSDGVQAGNYLEIAAGGADDGYHLIAAVVSETQLTLASALTLTTTGITFYVRTGHDKFWIAGLDFKRKPTIWRWDSTKQLVDYKIDLSGILELDEFAESIAYAGFISGASGWVSKHLGAPTNSTLPIVGDAYSPTGLPPAGANFVINTDFVDRFWLTSTPNTPVAYELMSAMGINPATDIIKVRGSLAPNPAVIGDPLMIQGGGAAIYGPGRDDAYLSWSEPIADFFTNPDELKAMGIENGTPTTVWQHLITGSVGFANDAYIFWNPTGSPFTIPDAGFASHVVPANSVSLWQYEAAVGYYHLQDRTIDPGVIPDRIGVYPVFYNWGFHPAPPAGFDVGFSVDTWQAGVPGTTKYIAFSTRSRYIRIPVMENPTDADIAVEFDYAGAMEPGYQISGSARDNALAGTVYALDAVNKNVKVITESTGVASSTVDLATMDGIPDGDVAGLATDFSNLFIGCKNYVYRIPIGVTSPDSDDVERLSYLRDLIDCDFGLLTDPLTGTLYLAILNNEASRLRTYEIEAAREALWQQKNVADENSVALYHLNEDTGNPQDSTAHGYNGVNAGMTHSPDAGRFAGAFQATAVGNSVDINAISAGFNGAEGALSVWFKADDYTTLAGTLARIYVDASNYVEILFSSGNLQFIYSAGGTVETISATSPVTDNGWHQYVLVWSATGDTVEAFFDGAQFGATQTGLGTWAGSTTVSTIGGGSATALGFYDEVHVSSIARAVYSKVQSYTDANKMWAYSGRDYEATYDADDPLGFHYRDEFFTYKFMGGDFIIRNDYEPEQLWPQNKVIEDSEVIFRGPTPLPTLGHTGRLARMLGLYLDRIADSREQMLDFFNRYRIDVESIPAAAEWLGLPGLDSEGWNVDKQRRFLRVMPAIMKRAARNVSYKDYARFLGFLVTDDHLQARRRFDSVHYNANYDPYVQAIPFDTMGSLDTGDERFPLALLRWRFYIRSTRSEVGVTSVPATRQLTDATATFSTTCEVGSLIHVNDRDSTLDNGEYLVAEILSDTVLVVNQDWPQGSLTGLTYTNNWEVPFPDPYVDFLIERFVEHIAPASMKVMHRDDTL